MLLITGIWMGISAVLALLMRQLPGAAAVAMAAVVIACLGGGPSPVRYLGGADRMLAEAVPNTWALDLARTAGFAASRYLLSTEHAAALSARRRSPLTATSSSSPSTARPERSVQHELSTGWELVLPFSAWPTQDRAMGIRYYAYPVAPQDTGDSKGNPSRFIGSDPLGDAWGLVPVGPNQSVMGAKPRPEMLYLDKCWRLLQRLTRPGFEEGRPAYRLFEGDVDAWAIGGYEPFVNALSPREVALVADDLESMGESDVDALFARDDFFARDGDREYLLQYLDAAREFVIELRERGFGLAYTIR